MDPKVMWLTNMAYATVATAERVPVIVGEVRFVICTRIPCLWGIYFPG